MATFAKSSQSNLSRDLFALTLDPGSGVALQAQLLDALRAILAAAPGRAGARLPASRTLAAELSVSRTTVQAAYDQLMAEGYLVAHRGSGTFVAEEITHLAPPPPGEPAPQRAVRAPDRAEPCGWQPFQTGIPDPALVPHRQWARHLERAWRDPGPALLGRPDPLGWQPLRVAIADHLAAWRKLDCDPDQVVITSGAAEAYEIVFRGLTPPGQAVAVEDPCWPRAREVLATAGARPLPVRIDRDGIDAARIPAEATAVVVTPSRHYPTGRSLPLSRRVALLDWAARHGGLIVEDDYDSEFRYRGSPLPSFAGLDGLRHVIYVGSFSKLVSGSIRIGYMVVPRAHVAQVRAYLDRAGARASLVPQPALAGFMASGEFAVHLRRMRRIYAQRQTHLLAALAPVRDLLDLAPDAAGMHLCLPLRPALSARATDREIARRCAGAGMQVGALSSHCVLPGAPEALLTGYAAFPEEALSDAAARLIAVLREV
ncbi:MocR-like pyridoxine biosynthesis transcription factor PdxR [Acidimangrovimonas sediminis]|uniref:MocR-like pyridoxine biosynthesis transcription factor PdxR n=1 Tax=Acidimangrovimonas sediminis TaxID=2056283 RepID=UPI000C807715|nr:PLP-dependent aminotransferase family protein [Acidimangrovimonas sediminis]